MTCQATLNIPFTAPMGNAAKLKAGTSRKALGGQFCQLNVKHQIQSGPDRKQMIILA